MDAETYDPAELLQALPLVKDVKPHHLHSAQGREPLVFTNGDLRRAAPAELAPNPELFPLPLGRLRRLLQLWPEGETVKVWQGAGCPISLRTTHTGVGTWEWMPVKPTQPRRFIILSGGNFTCRIYETTRYEYRPSPGAWVRLERW